MPIIPWNEPDIADFGFTHSFISVDVYETSAAIVAEISGFKENPEELDISVRSGVLLIRRSLSREEEKKEKGFWKKEKAEEFFEKAIQLPVGVDIEASEAILENNIVRVTIPKARGKPRTDKQLKIKN
jgi:HSP20 family protein